MELFTVEDVHFDSSTGTIIDGVSLSIQSGSVTAFIGRSGCGKSTLLKLIAGVLVPSGGRVLYRGRDIQAMDDMANKVFRRRCGFVFQDSALWANQTIMQNLELPLQSHFPRMDKAERVAKIRGVCSLLGYEKNLFLRPVDLSMGEQKRIAFARALIVDPKILFLDECIESLDEKSGMQIMELIEKFIDNNGTVLYVSHNKSFVKRIGGDIFEIEAGRLKDRMRGK
ncbi:MAG: ATP-binding cassette domain-containing protein [Treponema sp.]|nr:ATP-binding cassette domain-containing protein [Treponema sp.]